jgi:peptide/nickel transport system substrate-binding protein
MQTRDPLLSDVRIRRAIAHAVDRRMIVNFNSHGFASVNSSGVPVAVPAHTAVHDEWHAPDVDRARALLKEAGYRGQPVRIQANRKWQNMYANAVVIQAMLHAAGMNAHIDVMDWASQLANYYAGDFQLSSFSFSAQATPVLRYYKLIGDKDRRPVYLWENSRAITLRDEVVSAFGESERRRLYEQLHRLMIDDVPVIGLYNAQYAAGVLKSVQGFQPWPLLIPRLWGVRKDNWIN